MAAYNVTYNVEATQAQYEDTNLYASYLGGIKPRVSAPRQSFPSVYAAPRPLIM